LWREYRFPWPKRRFAGAQTGIDLRRSIALQQGAKNSMNISLSLAPLVSLVAGIVILIAPRLLNYIVAVYLIIVGLLGIFGDIRLH
jgi:hypothetical protein